jgi:hypothetical protein
VEVEGRIEVGIQVGRKVGSEEGNGNRMGGKWEGNRKRQNNKIVSKYHTFQQQTAVSSLNYNS